MCRTTKKTTQLILEGGNDYIVTLKDNQPRLLAQLETLVQQQKPEERFVDVEKKRGRIICQIVNVFTNINKIDSDWNGTKKSSKLFSMRITAIHVIAGCGVGERSLLAGAVEWMV